MIKYSLSCDNAHAFEGWFSESADFDRQVASGFLTCPVCNSAAISKTLMAPSVSTARRQEEKQAMVMDLARREAIAKLKEAVAAIKANAEDVGEKFPEEARKIHYGEADARGIIGQASLGEVRDLLDEGIEIAPLPVIPEDAN
ncbi:MULTISPECIES: DUF1178 family protein [Neorhizobium]|uniref:Protein containing DUF1178 n=3 Tax=Neorhizobium galegae TaxID=399 RepID=A0A068SKD0_NEOGA|nr:MULTISPECIES: DUF1178 family protein [Neorhizobium]KAB1085392.1 DUF1178 family protein [Neorhizobium galegae]MCJ9752403.1 DUF1178 family protein [Neorhizobium sp. BETTINA12A]MCQ1854268.1 DUF1178 family protein [Neorhizobium galegae]CDN46592.1 Hypothetical protein RG540_CH04010 [Neorhizobium galegae bv. orientalis str. HAMBI 540]CDN52798.1 Hypothetical protein RG1141_CH04370 [Neorhizobium galegae bv. officinalis bv. officinalis str. HAMBI 1141]